MEDRRKEPRKRVSRRAYVSDVDGHFYYYCFIRDASKQGCRVYSPDSLDLPGEVWIFPHGLNEPIAGKVAWRRKHMAGIHFAASSARARAGFPSSTPGRTPPTFDEIESRLAARAGIQRTAARPERTSVQYVRFAAARDYLATVIHELRMPIASIAGALKLVIDKALDALPQRFRDLLLIADRSTRRLEGVVDDYLDLEKLERGKISVTRAPADLVDVVRETLEAEAQFLEMHDVSCRVEAPDGSARVRIDRARIQQVLSNLISNAAKFSSPDSEVVLRVERHGAMFRLSVIDHGPGIEKEAQSRIFDRFEQAAAAETGEAKGTGLGLSICKSILALHGSTIQVDSEPGNGSVFYFDLPEIKTPAEPDRIPA